MDIVNDFDLEFLDLTDVDDYERHRVLSSLQPLEQNKRFPWFIGDERVKNEGVKVGKSSDLNQPEPMNNSQNYATKNLKSPLTDRDNESVWPPNIKPESLPDSSSVSIINSMSGPQMNSQYYGAVPQYYQPPVVPSLPNVPLHLSTTSYPEVTPNPNIYPAPHFINPTYPVKPPVFYGVPPTQPIFVPHHSPANEGYYINHKTYIETQTTQAEILRENIPMKNSVSPLSAETPAFTPKNQQSSEIPQTVEVQEPQPEPQLSEPEKTVPPQISDQQQNTNHQGSAWGSRKSWASLFTPKEGVNVSPQSNGLTKLAFPHTASQESNNNDRSCPIKNPKLSQIIDPDCYRMGEFLTSYSVDGRTISLQPRGLINQSNYCYINSILQALIACPPMYNLLSGLAENITSNAKRKPTPVIDGMCKFVKEYKHLPANMRVSNRRSDSGKKDPKKDQGALINTDIPFEPSWIYKILHGLQTDLIEGRQEDAEEFLGCLLNNLSDEMLELMKLIGGSEKKEIQEQENDEEIWQVMGNKNKGSVLRKTEFARTPITDIFGGSLKSRIQRIGGLSTENTQPFFTLPLNIEKVKTVHEALEALTGKNQLEGLTSAKTNEEIEAWQQVMLDELPVVLVLHLKCFDFKLDGCTKIVKALEFPIDLKIDTKLISSKTTNAKEKQYKLFAVVYHDGKEATKGHYVTDAFHVGYSSWLRYDDASVKPVLEENVLNPQGTRVPYLLFYRRSDTIRSR